MCPFLVLLFALLIPPLVVQAFTLQTTFYPAKLAIKIGDVDTVGVALESQDYNLNAATDVQILSEHESIAKLAGGKVEFLNVTDGVWYGEFNVSGVFLGFTNVNLSVAETKGDTDLPVIVTRPKRTIDTIFTASIITLVSLLYINFGAALDVTVLKGIFRRPIGPMIGFISQFLFMPLMSFGLGHIIFKDLPNFQLGLFFTGVSPAGGASNIWTLILGGNINLSLAMTTISTFAAFGMMPLWLFTLGKVLFDRSRLTVPYSNLASYAFGLIIPLAIGLAIQRCSPRLTRILVRILKPMSTILILFIIIFAIVTNLYLFDLFSLQIVIAGLTLPWLGYLFGFIFAKICGQVPKDALAIAIETGVQNTGIAIFMLSALEQPAADLTTVVPVAVAIFTPFPLLLIYIIQKLRGRRNDALDSVDPNNKYVEEDLQPSTNSDKSILG